MALAATGSSTTGPGARPRSSSRARSAARACCASATAPSASAPKSTASSDRASILLTCARYGSSRSTGASRRTSAALPAGATPPTASPTTAARRGPGRTLRRLIGRVGQRFARQNHPRAIPQSIGTIHYNGVSRHQTLRNRYTICIGLP